MKKEREGEENRAGTVHNAKIRPSRADGRLLLCCATQHEPPSLPRVMQDACLLREKIPESSGGSIYIGMRFLKLEVQQGRTRSSVAGLYRVV